jgi:polyphosphate kinase
MTKPIGSTYFPHDHFLNRELGLLAFNRRVLAMSENQQTPLMERLRYLCIVSSNMDEFFEVRVAGLKEQIKLAAEAITADGRSPEQVFLAISQAAHDIVDEQYALFNEVLLPALHAEGIHFLRRSSWTDAQKAWITDYFEREVKPVLTPIGLDPAHPFPRVLNKSLNFAVELEGKDAFGRLGTFAIVQAPRVLPRVILLPKYLTNGQYGFVFLSSILHAFVDQLFPGMTVQGCYQFRVTRNSNLFVDEEEVKNLRATIQGELPQRHFGDAVRLEVADTCPEDISQFLLAQFELSDSDLYRVHGPVNLVRLIQMPDQVDRPDLRFSTFQPGLPKQLEKRRTDVFSSIRKGDILLHHPYQSFQPVVDFLEQATNDPDVVAIKMTVYRTGTDSVLMDTLIRAARNGKEVTVVVELLARFDEEANISWAAKLEEAGAHVVFGVVGYKTHCKMMMVIRREWIHEQTVLRRYVHLGTGNYHPRTARLYTDFGLLTCHPDIGSDVSEIFQQLTGLGKPQSLKLLMQSPFTLHDGIIEAIRAETAIAKSGKPARIVAKMNALLEPKVIEALYEASQAGVRIYLIIRGVCALRPGVPGLSENIKVRSVIGRFLEHHRIFLFRANGEMNVWLSSADWMERNFFRRIESAFPILDPRIKRRVLTEGLRPYVADNTQSWMMDSEGRYKLTSRSRGKQRSAQEELMLRLGVIPT